MRKHIASLAVLLLSLSLSGHIALAQEQPAGSVVVSTGIAQITDNNIVTAQSGAIADAHRKALILASGTIMPFEQL